MTAVVASGDVGVAFTDGDKLTEFCLVNNTLAGGNPLGTFVPAFPASCPYVTTVGATSVTPGNTVRKSSYCEDFRPKAQSIRSGIPKLQQQPFRQAVASLIHSLFQVTSTRPLRTTWNILRLLIRRTCSIGLVARFLTYLLTGQYISKISVTMMSVHYWSLRFPTVVVVGGNFTLTGGTSASAPIVASLIAAVNDARLAAGKRPVGFINPAVCRTVRRISQRIATDARLYSYIHQCSPTPSTM